MKHNIICTMDLWDLSDLADNGSIPTDWRFRVKGGHTLYDEVGSAWRAKSDNFNFLRRSDLDKERFLPDDTQVEILRIQQGDHNV
jgi:hypothetical protein